MCCLAATSGDICGYFKLANIQNDSTAETNQNTHTPQLKQRNEVESQTSSMKETSLQRIYDGMDTDHVFSYKRVRNWKHQNPNSTKPRNTKYDLRHHLKPNCNETYKH